MWVLVGAVLLAAVAGAPPAEAAGAVWPIPGAVVRGYDPPEVRWAGGHRGVDLAGTADAPVVSP